MKVPTHLELLNPLLRVMHHLGGSGSIHEIDRAVAEREKYPKEVVEELHSPEKGNRTRLSYNLAWSRTYLRNFGLLENSGRAVWALTSRGSSIVDVDPRVDLHTVTVAQFDQLTIGHRKRDPAVTDDENVDQSLFEPRLDVDAHEPAELDAVRNRGSQQKWPALLLGDPICHRP